MRGKLDDARDPATGAAKVWAAGLVARLASYAVVSPSGTGVKVFGRGTWAGGWHRRPHDGGGEVEVYDRVRYFAVTGRPVGDWPVADLTDRLPAVLRPQRMGKGNRRQSSVPATFLELGTTSTRTR